MYVKRRPVGDCTPHTGQKNGSPSGTDKSENTPASDHNQAAKRSSADHFELDIAEPVIPFPAKAGAACSVMRKRPVNCLSDDISALPDGWDQIGSREGVEYVREPSCSLCFFYKKCDGGAGHAAPFGKASQLNLDDHLYNIQKVIWIGGRGECWADPFSQNERWPVVSSNGWCGKWRRS